MSEANDSDIAIIGMAIRVPDANGPEQFWTNLTTGLESVRSYTDEELLAKGVSPATLADPHYVKSGIPLQDLDQFDPEFFGFSPKEAGILDPQHRHFYEVCWEALERAGHTPEGFDGAIGLFGGCGMGAYFTFNLLTNPELVDNVGLFLLRHTGNDKDFLVTRVSYAFNLKGPSVNVQTACSTSLVAAHMAVQSLLSGECDMALAGGVTIEFPHGVGYHYKEGEVLSPDGHCRTFDHRSKGTVFGSGAGVVVMRRLADALADGDHIHAIIKGSAVNNDGSRKVGYLAPSVDGQAACVAEALAVADIDADTLSYVECHGTATPVGDPIEIAALTQAFRASSERVGYCKVGSVKTNIGHLDTAAGVASLIKASLALEHQQIPPSLNFEAPNPRIGFEGSPFVVANTLADWQRGSTPRRAGVNSLGVGGTNAFVVLQEPPVRPASPVDAAPQLLLLSARNRKALDENGKRLAAWLRAHPEAALADVAWTLKAGRRGFEQRRVLAAADTAEAIRLLEEGDPKRVFTHSLELERPRLAFMFPGGGAQYVQMGRGLYEREPVFRQVIDQGLAILKNRFGADLAPVLLPQGEPAPDLVERIGRPSAQLPLTFLVEMALTRLWEHYGVKPDMVIGHSMGENAAACVAGVFSFEDGLGLLLLRGQLVEQTPPGGMVSVPMAAADLKPLLGDALDLASANSPQLSVFSGPPEALDALSEKLKADGIDSQRVRVNVAGHSRLLDGILPRFRAYLQSIRLHPPKLPIVSNHTGKLLDAAQATDPEYWVQHFRHAILFADGVDTLLANDDLVFLEVGPGNMLGSFVRQNPRAPGQRVLSSMRHPQDATPDDVYFRTVMGRLWALGVDFAAEKLWGKQRRRLPLPTYAFQHARYWIDPGIGSAQAGKADAARPLKLPELGDWFRKPRWVQQGIVELDEQPHTWLAFVGRDALSRALVARLREAGHRVVSVLPGDAFAQLDEHSYTLAAEAGGAGYQELVDALAARELAPDRVLHGWLVTLDRAFRPGSTFLHRNQEHGFYSLFHLVRALSKAGLADAALHLTVLANGAQRVGDEPLPFPDKATALGPCAVIPREFPGLSCAFVDIDLASGASNGRKPPPADAEAARVAADIADELFAPAGSRVVAWRKGVRWQRHIGPFKAAPTDAAPRLRDGGSYLITGGLGGIGGVLAEWLARHCKAKLALIGRTPLPQRGDWDDWLARHKADDSICRAIVQIRRLEALGATVLPLAADVAVAESMAEAVAQARQAFGPIHGVFHAAGVIRDSLIAMKSPRDIEDVFAAKIYGTLILDELLRETPLDFMVLFSSTSAYIAPAGQVDYVGASAFVNAFAESCRGQRRYPVTAIAWGVWKDVGLVGTLGTPKAAAADDAGIAHAEALDVASPHFARRYVSRDGLAQQHLLTGTLSAEDHWEIDEHRLGSGEALLPGTGYLELIRAALAEIGHAAPWQLSNLVFEAPLFVADGAPRDFRLKLRGDGQRWDVELLAATAGGYERCASARIQPPQGEARADSVPLAAIDARCQSNVTAAGGSSRLRIGQEAHLRFGPRWRVLQRLQYGEREALARLQLSPEFAGDLATHALHPGLLDIATGCAMDLIPGYASQDVAQNLWAPISYRGFAFHAPLEAELVSWIRLAGEGSSVQSDFAAFDVTLTDTSGRVLAEVEQLTLRRLDGPWHAPRPAVAMSAAEDAGAQAAKPLSPGEQALHHNVSQGIAPAEGMQALARLLAGTLPAEAIVSSMRVDELIVQAEAITRATSSGSDAARFSRPELDSDFAPPRDAIEKTLAELWGKLLGVEGVGIRDSFFDLGGHSLIAVRLFNEVNDKFKVDLPMSVLMQSPTIEGLATLVRGAPYSEAAAAAETSAAAQGEPAAAQPAALRFRHVVPMHSGPVAGRTPLFVVAGMFGNVLNLSHLAHLLGEERPFYALQARGLYGDASPHESFEEAAADYIAEVKQVQPEGPYLLGGFSGGGLVAYEMARQLIAAGDEVQAVLMLDTPAREIPRFSLGDKVTMLAQSAQREGLGIIGRKIGARLRWEREKRQRRAEANGHDNGGELNFQSRRIGDAFVRGLVRYKVPKVPVKVAVFRPKLDVRYRLSGGRLVDSARNYVREDNFWTPYTQDLQVFEVPGNHDNMVLEPNVRVLVSSLRRVIDQLGRE